MRTLIDELIPNCRGQEKLFLEPASLSKKQLSNARAMCDTCPLFWKCRRDNDAQERLFQTGYRFMSFYSCLYAGETPIERYRRRTGKRR